MFLGNFMPFLLVFRSVFCQRHLIVERICLGMLGFFIFEVRFRDVKAKISKEKNSMNKKVSGIIYRRNTSRPYSAIFGQITENVDFSLSLSLML